MKQITKLIIGSYIAFLTQNGEENHILTWVRRLRTDEFRHFRKLGWGSLVVCRCNPQVLGKHWQKRRRPGCNAAYTRKETHGTSVASGRPGRNNSIEYNNDTITLEKLSLRNYVVTSTNLLQISGHGETTFSNECSNLGEYRLAMLQEGLRCSVSMHGHRIGETCQ